MGELTGLCAGTTTTQKNPVSSITINRVSNGFIVNGNYGVESKIANTLDEALALAKKEFEN